MAVNKRGQCEAQKETESEGRGKKRGSGGSVWERQMGQGGTDRIMIRAEGAECEDLGSHLKPKINLSAKQN